MSGYTAGRIRRPRLIILHTAETPCEAGRARGIVNYLTGAAVQASCHWAVDPAETVPMVDEADTAWAAPGANADGIQIEQAGYAAFTAEQWGGDAQQQMLRRCAALVAGISARWGIPLDLLDAAQVAAGASGVTTHVEVSKAYRRSDHWDCGPSYPAAQVLAWAAGQGTISGEDTDLTPDEKKQLADTAARTAQLVELMISAWYPRGMVPAEHGDVTSTLEKIGTKYTSEPTVWGARLELERMARSKAGAATPAVDLASVPITALLAEVARRVG